MNRNEYMKEMEKALKRLPKEEREEALSYYREYFDDAGPEGEQEAILEFGAARTAAAHILKTAAVKRLESGEKPGRKRISTIWIILLALFAAPVGLPLLGASAVVALALLFSAFAVLGSLILTGVLLAVIGAFSVFAGLYVLPSQPADGIFILGTALMEAGVGLAFVWGCLAAGRGICYFTMRSIKRHLLKGDKKA